MRSARCAAGAPPRPPGSSETPTRRAVPPRSGRDAARAAPTAGRPGPAAARSADPEPGRAPPRDSGPTTISRPRTLCCPRSRTRARAVARDRDRRRPAPRPAGPPARSGCASAPGPADSLVDLARVLRGLSQPLGGDRLVPERGDDGRERLARVEEVGLGRLPRARRPTRLCARTRPQRSSSQETSPAIPDSIAASRRVRPRRRRPRWRSAGRAARAPG